MSLMIPYTIAFTLLAIVVILAFYIIGIPIGFGTGVGGDEGAIYPQLFQYSNDSHLYKEGILTGYNNTLNI